MRTLRKISRKYYLRQIVACWMMCAMLFALTPARIAQALPSNPVLKYGNATWDFSNPLGVTVTVNGMQHIIHWDSLNTTQAEFLRFLGTNNAAVLNRVMNGSPTAFNGWLDAAGMRIFMINPAGIVFGKGARINVAQLVASSLDISDSDFLANRLVFGKLTDNYALEAYVGDVIFNAHAGDVAADRIYLIGGKEVWNKGGLVANDCVVMAAGNSVLISELDSSVVVEVDMGGLDPSQFKVKNKDQGGDGVTTKLEAEHIILAAGDLWSQAISNVKTVEIDVAGEIEAGDLASINAYSGPGSDAVAGVSIASGDSVTIDDDITVTAVGNGVDNAYSTIDITSGGNLTIESDGSSGTDLLAHASDGLNNDAKISLTATGTVTVDAPDRVTIVAEAEAGKATALLNQARVNVTAETGDVSIHATDFGSTDQPALIQAYAHDGQENRADVDIQAPEGNVEIIGEGYGDNAIVEVLSESGVNNYAKVVINAGGDVDIIAREGTARPTGTTEALVRAEARNAEVSNDAEVDIDAGGDVTVKSEGGQLHDHDSEFTPFVAAVKAIAENAGASNTALVDVTAGGDVVVLSEDGGEARVEAYAGNVLASHNTATVNLTAEDGYVLVHAIEGHSQEHEFTPSEASVKATAENAFGSIEEPGTNDATITIVAKDIVEEEPIVVATTEGDEEDYFGDGDVGVIAVNGGKAEVEAIAKHGDKNSAGVNVTADSDVEVIALCEDQPSEAEIMALAKDAEVSNTARVGIDAGGDVAVLADNGGKAEIEAIAKDGPTNQADVDITAGGEVTVKAEGGLIDEWKEKVVDSWDVKIKKLIETWDVKIQQLNEAEHWHWKFHKRDGHPEYTYIITYVYVQPSAPPGYHYDNSVDHDEAIYNTAWLNDCPEHNPNPADYGKPGWELAGVWQDHKTHWDYAEIPNCPVPNPDPAAYGYANWTIYDTEENYHYEDHSRFVTPSYASIDAIAEDDLQSNTANILINAGDDVKVMAFDGGQAEMIAETEDGELNTSGITINSNGDVKVLAIGYTETTDDGKTASDASVKAKAEDGLENTATIGINAVGGDVLVLGKEGSDAAITALAKDAESPKTNTANVTITATEVEFLVEGGDTPETTDDVYDTEGGDVKVIAEKGGEAEIEALAIDGVTNVADVLICIDGGVKVKGEKGGEAEIEALAKGWDSTNTATVGIGAKGEEGVEVIADRGGEAGISSKAKDGEDNTASTVVVTKGGVLVKATRGGDAEILAQAKYGYYNDAYVGVCAVGSVVVQTGEDDIKGCDAVIRAEADTGYLQLPMPMPGEEPIITTAKAETVVVSHQGNVEVLAYNHGHSGIEAEAEGAHLNTASVGVAAGADLSPADVIVVPEIPGGEVLTASVFDGPYYSTGKVIVEARNDSEAQIFAYAHDASPIYEYPEIPGGDAIVQGTELPSIPGENTASVVICAPGKVDVYAERGSTARIKSQAGPLPWQEDEGSINKATTRVYASEVTVDAYGPGNGIRAYAYGVENQGKESWCLTIDGEVASIVTNEDGSSELIIQDYSQRVDCPDCPPCPCEEEVIVSPAAVELAAEVPAPVAPLPVYDIPSLRGCPQLTLAAASELGIPDETLQIGIGAALALNSTIQPCQACASLLNAASILKDVDGSRMAAMVQVFNAMAPADAPYTPEMATSIAMAFEDAAEGSQYASAMEFIDAFVQYATALDELGSPVGDSTAFVMDKYGAGLGDNANMASFVAGRVASGQTF